MRENNIGYIIPDCYVNGLLAADDQTAGHIIDRALRVARGEIDPGSGSGVSDLLADRLGLDMKVDRAVRESRIISDRERLRSWRARKGGKTDDEE